MQTESDILCWLKERCKTGPEVVVGIGDDAAVLEPPPGPLIFASDQMVAGVHFTSALENAEWIGRKALARNLSDVAAMAARPWAVTLSVARSQYESDLFMERFFHGFLKCAAEHQVTLVGGDLARSPSGFYVDVAVLGALEGRRPLLRSGARTGDDIIVSGVLGGAQERHHFTFEPRWREAIRAMESGWVHAGMDLSDGLGKDLATLLAASGKGGVIDLGRIPRRITQAGNLVSVTAAIQDGEDFELLFTTRPGVAAELWDRTGLLFTVVGTVTNGDLVAKGKDGVERPWEHTGYEHRFDGTDP